VRTLIKRDFDALFEKYDCILSPTVPAPAFRIREKSDPMQMYLTDIYTSPVNIAGLAAMSLPCGLSPQGLPIGLQLIAKPLGSRRCCARLTRWSRSFRRSGNRHLWEVSSDEVRNRYRAGSSCGARDSH
jgi:aspartyl-tRNA(Asn)/glutamyl-tRNA(Gln) amidotransferase subunit A